ncbi:MAG: cobaltochelatase subunit CobT, partial [Sphingomonadales bacterium]|nr:cobaltochelatase subunit CobT [Sphingomonadales bacterium]
MTDRNPLDDLKAALAGAARAMSEEPEVELAFTADTPVSNGRHIKVPMPSRELPADQVAEARGFADAAALKLKYHDDTLHAVRRPGEALARMAFDAVEQARVEALGARRYAGVRDNLGHALELKLKSDPISRARSRDEVPIATALGLMVRERLTGEASPEIARTGLELVRDWIEEKAGADLDALEMLLDDQRGFAELATRLLEDLELVDGDAMPEEDEEGGGDDEDPDENDGDQDQDEDAGADGQAEMRPESTEEEGDREESEIDDDQLSDADMGDKGEE